MDRTKNMRSQALDLLRFPLACVVVTIHLFDGSVFTMHGVETDLRGYSCLTALIAFCKAFLAGQSVPIYFFIAGYVFFLGITLTKTTYLKKMKNRFRSLLIPYILWNTIAIAMTLLPFLPVLHRFFPGCDISDIHITLKSLISCFWNYTGELVGRNNDVNAGLYPIDYPMWFMRELMIVALFSPVIHLTLKRFGMLLPATAGMLWFCLPNIAVGHIYQLTTAIFFFSLGAYFSFNRRDMVAEFRRFRTAGYYAYTLSGLYLLLYTYASGSAEHIIQYSFIGTEMIFVKNITVVAGLFAAYNLAVDLIEKHGVRPVQTLSSAAFFIYAGHVIPLYYVKNIIALVLPPVNDFNAILMYLSTDIVTCGGLLLLYMGMRRFTPWLLSPLVGGRL